MAIFESWQVAALGGVFLIGAYMYWRMTREKREKKENV